ncbi:MAG TPA: hypothetical protein DIT55_05750 [Spirochaetaceae bacterium]|nr:hypothetical protein [Spirochaetaceae bacterium]
MKKHDGGRKKPSRKNKNGAINRMAVLVVLAMALTVTAALLMRPRTEKQTEGPLPSTTIWPYGLPEYSIELPEGYEGLLPQSAVSPAPAEGGKPDEAGKPTEKPLGVANSLAVQTPASSKPRAESYVLGVRDEMLKEGRRPTLIIVIDDAGYNLDQLRPFLALPFPLTIAVLPQVDQSVEAARIAAEAGKEIILHQPMQALGGNDPGPGAILLDMPVEEAASLTASNLDSLQRAVGMNNHMGSAVTRHEPLMGAILDLVKRRGIYYLDSRTVPDTATAVLCLELSIPYWERDVFLDNTGDKQSILHALEEGKKIASARGASVLIGHVWSAELAQTLMDIYPQLYEEGYSLSTISKYMIRNAVGDDASGHDDARPGD